MKSFQKKTKAEWREIIAAWKDSGMTVREFCRQQGIRTARFYKQRKQLGFNNEANSLTRREAKSRNKQREVKFLPVEVKDLAVAAVAEKPITLQRLEIFLGNGAVLRFSGELSDDISIVIC